MLQEIQRRILILIGDKLANLRAWFLSSMSLTTEGGSRLTLFDGKEGCDASLFMGIIPPKASFKTELKKWTDHTFFFAKVNRFFNENI